MIEWMLLKVIILGIVQGLTEFLPVSSTAHLVLLEKLFGFSEATFGLAFDISLHVGTALALIIYFFKDFKMLFLTLVRWIFNLKEENKGSRRLLINLIIALIPAGIVGVLFQKDIENIFRSPFWIGLFLILFSFVFYIAEVLSKKSKELKEMKLLDSLIIGLNQAIALIPGVSRSGVTISAGLLLNFKREDAGRFAFLLSTPIIIGAFLKEHGQTFLKFNLGSTNSYLFLIGTLTSFIVGYFTLKFFLKYLNKGSLIPFVIYRIILGIVIFWYFL